MTTEGAEVQAKARAKHAAQRSKDEDARKRQAAERMAEIYADQLAHAAKQAERHGS